MQENQQLSSGGLVVKKGYKFPIYPTAEQKVLLEKTFGCCRYVYNRALAESIAEYEAYKQAKEANPYGEHIKPRVSGFDFANKLPSYKADPASTWLTEVSSNALVQSMLHLGEAFARFFKEKKGYPTFKKKQGRQSFTLTKDGFRFKGDKLFIAKSKDVPLKVVYSRPLPSSPSSCTISRTPAGKYFISFICDYSPPPTTGTGRIGIDLGIKDFAVLSTGERIANPKFFVTAQKKLKRAQQAHARKKKGSKNREKARIKVAKQHDRIANCRNNFTHQLSRRLVNENQVIALESLNVKNMIKCRSLSKHIADASWSSFVEKLIYKAYWSQHCKIVKVDAYFPSSHLCSETGLKLDRKLNLSEREWLCPHCGKTHDRDLNAAINILQEGERGLAELLPAHPSSTLYLVNSSR